MPTAAQALRMHLYTAQASPTITLTTPPGFQMQTSSKHRSDQRLLSRHRSQDQPTDGHKPTTIPTYTKNNVADIHTPSGKAKPDLESHPTTSQQPSVTPGLSE